MTRRGIKHLFRGVMTHALFNLLDLARETGLGVLFEGVIDPVVEKIKPFRKRARVKRLVKAIRFMYVKIVLTYCFDQLFSESIPQRI